MEGRRRGWVGLAAVMLACLLAGGCGSSRNPSVDEGMSAIEALDYETALQHFDKAILDGEDLRMVYRGIGLARMGMTQYEAAAEAFEKALDSGNGRPDEMDYDMNYYLAAACYKLGQKEKSIRSYDAIIALRPKERLAYYLRGSVLIDSDFEKAKADFDKAISLGREDYDQLIDICLVLEQHGYEEVGAEYLQTALAGESKALTDYQRGRLYYYLEDYENARNYLEKAKNTEGSEAVLLLGQTYEALGDYNYAISVYNGYIEKDQTNPQVYNRLGLCKMEQKAYDEALAAFQAGINIENNDLLQTLKFNEIAACERLGEFRRAAVLMESYLAAYPDDAAAQREYIFLKTR
ncbi:MAG: tetratricopeptide repeat protein [Lachnospiraceae bacterium]|nr:tetratricopeptide repeat protein [Lachnospiraceae bacterium]